MAGWARHSPRWPARSRLGHSNRARACSCGRSRGPAWLSASWRARLIGPNARASSSIVTHRLRMLRPSVRSLYMNRPQLFAVGLLALLLVDALGVTLALTAGAFLIAVILGVRGFFVVWVWLGRVGADKSGRL